MGAASAAGRDLREEERDRDRERRREQQGDERRDDRPVDERQCAVGVLDRVPGLRPDEREAELLDRRPGVGDDLIDDHPEQHGRRHGGGDRDALEEDVAEPDPAALELGARRRGVVPDRRHMTYAATFTLASSRYANALTGVGSGTKKSGGPNFCPWVTAQ